MSCYKTMVWLVGVVLVFIMVEASNDEVKKVDDLLKLIKNVEELKSDMNHLYYFPFSVWTEKACDGKNKTIKGTYAQYLYPTSDFNKAYMFWIRVDNKNIKNFLGQYRMLTDTVSIKDAFYIINEVSDVIKQKWNFWFKTYAERLQHEVLTSDERKTKMNQVNPKYVLRNYMAQLAIDDANKGDYKLIDELFNLLKKPYDEQPENEKWFVKRPDWARHKVGCSMLSCSS